METKGQTVSVGCLREERGKLSHSKGENACKW